MARLPALIDDLAEHDTRGRATVELIARMIREAGHIQTTGRGRAAAEMTAKDAAALLIGLCTAEAPKDAPKAVELFSTLVPFGQTEEELSLFEIFPNELGKIASSLTFLEALESVISCSEDILRMRNRASSYYGRTIFPSSRREFPFETRFFFSVVFHQPSPRGKIIIEWEDEDARSIRRFHRQFYHPQYAGHIKGAGSQPGPLVFPDRLIDISVGLKTFIRLKRLLDGAAI